MDHHTQISFLLYVLINAITPGPGNLLAMESTIRFGWRNSIRLLLGIFSGYYLVQIFCAFLIFKLNQKWAMFISVMKYVGAIYIAWLAVSIARSRPGADSETKSPTFIKGFILQLINIKIYLFGITTLSGYVVPFYHGITVLVSFELFIATTGTIATIVWAILGHMIQHIYQTNYRIINIVLSLLLLECVASLLLL